MKSLSDTCRDKAPTVSSSPFFYTLPALQHHLDMAQELSKAPSVGQSSK
jgi:hypothetical protein